VSVVAVVGLGYVGLPLAIELGKKHKTIGFDPNTKKIENYRHATDPTGEVSRADFESARNLEFSNQPNAVSSADIVIVAVPTPIDEAHRPDFGPLKAATDLVGKHMKKGATVVYESTVYPGATEEVCVPILEGASGMTWKKDFHVAYSPERINPGDQEHTLTGIVKVVAGDDAATLDAVAKLYESVIPAGVHRTSSIMAAEAAKVIENTQRDLNIALMNELAIIFDKLGLDTLEVLQAAGTKWNFLPFRPGLVGGHCISVDPYYLTYKAEMLGYHPQVILAGRQINDGMGKYVAEQTIKQMIRTGHQVKGAKVNVLGLTFKEDVPDLRNSRVIDVVTELKSYGVEVYVHDPIAEPDDARREYDIDLVDWDDLPVADGLIAAVAHKQFMDRDTKDFAKKLNAGGCFIDVKSKFDPDKLRTAGLSVWRL